MTTPAIRGPVLTTHRDWDAHIAGAASFTDAQERIEQALHAGVDIAVLLAIQAERIRREDDVHGAHRAARQ